MTNDDVLLAITGLKKYFPIRGGMLNKDIGSVKAIDGINLFIRRGETVGLVGESGCGKTTTGRCTLMLTPPTAGNVYYKTPDHDLKKIQDLERQEALLNVDANPKSRKRATIPELEDLREKYALNRRKSEDLRRLRSNMQIVFQDPYSSLNPRMLIKDIVGEPLKVHGVASGAEVSERVRVLMEKVGLSPEHIYRFPHEFSGGQRQRIGVARALSLNPDFIVLDEPTSALDVSVQAQILNLMNDLQKELNLTYMFISHDLSTIKYMCDRINIMYLGKVVESGTKADIFTHGLHPYTEALLNSIPLPDPRLKRERVPLSGDVPSPANPPIGCRFHTRCRYRQEICEIEDPPLVNKGGDHFVACHFR